MTKRMVLVGDLFPVPSNFERFSEGDISYLFGDRICSIFKSADYRICNLEGALTDHPGKCEKTGPVLYAPTSVIHGLEKLGIDCCTLANNHITDAGPSGVIDTLEVLRTAGIDCIGAGPEDGRIRHHRFVEMGDKKICLYNVAETMYNAPSKGHPGAFLYDEFIVCKELQELKGQCDFLIVLYHGGQEKYRYPSPLIRKRFHKMADSGADMVLSQHTHCVGSEEYYQGSYLLYGQGNFLFRSFNNEFTDTGLIIELLLDEEGFHVEKYLVDAVSDTVRYNEVQDLSSFYERSSRIQDEAFLDEQFKAYCKSKLPLFLKSYKGKIIGLRIIRKFLPGLYKRIYMNRFERNQLLFILHSLRSEQNREVAIKGLEEYLKEF